MRTLSYETAYCGTPYENSVRVVKEEANEVKKLLRVQSNDNVYFDEEVDHDFAPHLVKETNDNNDYSHDNNSEEEMSDDLDDDRYNRYDEYNEYGKCDRGIYYSVLLLTEEQDEVDDTDEKVDEDDEADGIDGIIEGVAGINISDKLSDKCRDELKEKMNLVSADKVGIPSLTLAFLYCMKFLNEGDIVNMGKQKQRSIKIHQ
ncbi:hypothetical protein C1646_737901 [Rhizophagus diaphanus]|nr:hypothetical protein C1646_737901 [Rhizophagus diaphanus] [Rhizophagus sp. MUCL 43196]